MVVVFSLLIVVGELSSVARIHGKSNDECGADMEVVPRFSQQTTSLTYHPARAANCSFGFVDNDVSLPHWLVCIRFDGTITFRTANRKPFVLTNYN
jgi:hypothetical protein